MEVPDEIAQIQWREVTKLIAHAERTVPYYTEVFRSLGLSAGDIKSSAGLARLPALDKATVREHRSSLHSTSFRPEQLIRSATGGSTGEPMRFCYNRESWDQRVAAAMRGDSWAGWQLCGGELHLGCPAPVPGTYEATEDTSSPFRVASGRYQ